MQRDLACRDLWAESLERAYERRLRDGSWRPSVPAGEFLPRERRDLTDPALWQRSSWRAHARRQAAEQSLELAVPSPRGLTLAALLAMAGGPVIGFAGALTSAPVADARPHSPKTQSRGAEVAALQRALGVSADGVFGPQTERALRRYQRRHGLTVDGIAGPQTRSRLGLGRGPVLKRKSHNSTGSNSAAVVQRVIAAANRIATKPYRYGGGHGSFTDSGYDCSGSVSYALHGGGLLGRPRDSGGFMSYGRAGPGRRITIYANPGHVYMTVDGRRFDTSARRVSGSRWTTQARSTAGYAVRHPAGL